MNNPESGAQVPHYRGDETVLTNQMCRHLSYGDKLYIVKRQGGVCASCHNSIALPRYPYCEFDHIKPISQGGTHTWDNIQALCLKCHTKKSQHQVGHDHPHH